MEIFYEPNHDEESKNDDYGMMNPFMLSDFKLGKMDRGLC
jgi:hypothetical protein